jgi:hypothetical protein
MCDSVTSVGHTITGPILYVRGCSRSDGYLGTDGSLDQVNISIKFKVKLFGRLTSLVSSHSPRCEVLVMFVVWVHGSSSSPSR